MVGNALIMSSNGFACPPLPVDACIIFLTQDSQATQRRSEELHHHPFTTENGVLYTRFEEPDILIPT
jgi:hypothetical protein